MITSFKEYVLAEAMDDDPCWKNYKMVGRKIKNEKSVPNCVPGKGVPKMRKEGLEEGVTVAVPVEIDGKKYSAVNGRAYVHSNMVMGRWNTQTRSMRKALKPGPHHDKIIAALEKHKADRVNEGLEMNEASKEYEMRHFNELVKKYHRARRTNPTLAREIKKLAVTHWKTNIGGSDSYPPEDSFKMNEEVLDEAGAAHAAALEKHIAAAETEHEKNGLSKAYTHHMNNAYGRAERLNGMDWAAHPGLKDRYITQVSRWRKMNEDKSEMACNKPRAQAHGSGETGKSHVVKACSGGKERLIRFGQLGVKGSPKKKGESEAYANRRKRFKTRHAKNIAKGKMSAAYWANKVKW